MRHEFRRFGQSELGHLNHLRVGSGGENRLELGLSAGQGLFRGSDVFGGELLARVIRGLECHLVSDDGTGQRLHVRVGEGFQRFNFGFWLRIFGSLNFRVFFPEFFLSGQSGLLRVNDSQNDSNHDDDCNQNRFLVLFGGFQKVFKPGFKIVFAANFCFH